MARRFIADLQAGERVEEQVFLIASKDLRTTTSGGLYIHAVLVDRTGQIPARMWQASEAIYATMPTGGFMLIKGRAESYKGSMQFIIEALRAVDQPKEIDLADFLPRTEGDIEEMWRRTQEILGEIQNEYVSELIGQFLADEELVRRFKIAPAALQMHHAYLGGLLEHTLNVLEMALLVVPRYPKVSLDLVLAGVFLHDIAKIAELKYDTSFAFTDGGQLVGHIVQGAIWIELKTATAAKKMGKPFPAEIKWVLQHIVLAHHGRYEFGSPKLPAIPEVMAVHHLDNIDAKLNMMQREIDTDPDPKNRWTQYSRALETRLYKPDVLKTPADPNS